MLKIRTEEIDTRLEAISTLKAASKQWPEGWRHDLVRQWLERGVTELQDDLFELLAQSRGIKAPDRPKSSSDPKQ